MLKRPEMRYVFFSLLFVIAGVASAEAQNCRKGKPCGNTCIARNKTCHVGRGTATWAPGVTDTSSSSSERSAGNSSAAAKAAAATAAKKEVCRITSIVDGDTFHCDGYTKGIRLLLIDAPEKDQGPYGADAAKQLAQLLQPGTYAELEFDVQRLDRYGRPLAYVYQGGVMVNEEMARRGYAVSLTYPPNVKYVDRIRSAVEEAKSAKRGLWSGSAFECAPADHRKGKC